MKTRKRHLTSRITPATRNAIMDQLAAAANEIIRLREMVSVERRAFLESTAAVFQRATFYADKPRPWYARLMWWRK